MPIEIKELNIKAYISDDNGRSQAPSTSAPAADREEIISECVERLLQILKDQNEK